MTYLHLMCMLCSVTFCTLVTSVVRTVVCSFKWYAQLTEHIAQILYQGLKASASQIITVVLAFSVICTGIIILQMTKVDPRSLNNVRRCC